MLLSQRLRVLSVDTLISVVRVLYIEARIVTLSKL